MSRFKIIEQERTFWKAQRPCDVCKKEYEVYVFLGTEYFTIPFECQTCNDLLWYDYFTDKFNNELYKKYEGNEKRPELIWKEIEKNLPPCQKCSGKYKQALWFVYGAPEHCPHCHVSQRTNGTPLDKDKIRRENKAWTKAEKVFFVTSNDEAKIKP